MHVLCGTRLSHRSLEQLAYSLNDDPAERSSVVGIGDCLYGLDVRRLETAQQGAHKAQLKQALLLISVRQATCPA